MRFAFITVFIGLILASGSPKAADRAFENPRFDPANDQSAQSGSISMLIPPDIDATIDSLMEQYQIPGLQACITQGDSVVWAGSYGYKDDELTVPVTDSSLFILASISKTVIATAVHQCVENGLIDLDADISHYLPFNVRNAYYPSDSITGRMIMSHVASISRNDGTWIPDMVYGEDWSGDWVQYLEDYFVEGGPTWDSSNFLDYPVGTHYEYSNYA